MKAKTKNRFYIFLAALVIIVGALGFWYLHRNSFSRGILKLEILSQDSVDFGQEVEYTVKYKNNGNVYLEDAKLIFEYPDHSIVSDQKPLWQEIPLDDIYPGEERTMSFKARLIGQEGEVLTANARLDFKPKNLNATYESDTSFTTQIKSVPLNFEFDLPSSIEPGKNFSFRINYFSNIDYPISNLRVTMAYPSDFVFVSSNPQALGKTDWDLPVLNKADGGRIQISGQAQGQTGQQELFDAKIGIWQNGEFILLKEITKSISIVQPALKITQQINGNPDFVASSGDQLHYEISFKNVGNDTLSNLSLIDTLSGDIFDLQSTKSPNGTFTPGDNSITWDWRNVPSLQILGPQEEGMIEFWVDLKSDFDIPSMDGNLAIQNNVYLNQVQETFVTKVNSKLQIVGKGFYQDEVFGNSGPIPPALGQTTTYTISWQAKNYYNSVKSVTVKAVLPPQSHLTGKIFPEDSHITYDSQSREIVWAVGDMTVGQGVLNSPPNVSFQVAFTPDSSQVGQVPDIIGPVQILGNDAWTGNSIFSTTSSIKTNLPDDPNIHGQGTVAF